jgi:hypothetical protein
LETPEEIKSKRIKVLASSLPGFELDQKLGPYVGQGIHFDSPDSPLMPETMYIFHVSENYLDRHSLMSSSFFGKGKDIKYIPILNSGNCPHLVKTGDKLGCFEEIHPEDLFEIHERTDVTCWTDHIALCCLTRVNQPRNQRLTRWLIEFLDANVTLRFLNGRLHHAADACSHIFAPELEAPVAKQKYISIESSAEDLMAIQ